MVDKTMTFQSVGRTHVGSVRARNEDAIIEHAEAGLWAVADGMGGHAAGDVASRLIIEAIGGLYPNAGVPLAAQVRAALIKGNEHLYSRRGSNSDERTMGTTIVVLGAEGKRWFCIWAGDSRLYLLRGGTLTRLTRDHSYVQELVDAGLLKPGEADRDPRRSVIMRAVGVHPELKLDQRDGDIVPGDVFLLASDGVTSVCSDEELRDFIDGCDLDAAAEHIVETCLSRGAPDNLSLVLVKPSSL
jgi:serine/threonine protein phosphatase Stp1